MIEFPISGGLRTPLLIIEFVAILICFEMAILFLIRYRTPEKELRNLQELAFFSLLLGFGIMWLFFIIGDYYAPNESIRYLFLNFGYFGLIFGVLFFTFYIERYKIFFSKKYLFSLIFLICTIAFVMVFFIDMVLAQSVTYVFFPVLIIFIVLYLLDFTKKATGRSLLYGILKHLSGLGFLLIGILLTTDAILNLIGIDGRIFGAIMQLFGLIMISLFFFSLPPFSEFDWKEKIQSLFIINKSGICLYYKIFQEKKDQIDENLISAAVTGMEIVLKEITGSKGNKVMVIKKKGNNIIIYPGEHVSGVINITEPLNTPKRIIKNLVDTFENLFENSLKEGESIDTTIFNPAEKIVDDLFN